MAPDLSLGVLRGALAARTGAGPVRRGTRVQMARFQRKRPRRGDDTVLVERTG